jgi:hypothetical protein
MRARCPCYTARWHRCTVQLPSGSQGFDLRRTAQWSERHSASWLTHSARSRLHRVGAGCFGGEDDCCCDSVRPLHCLPCALLTVMCARCVLCGYCVVQALPRGSRAAPTAHTVHTTLHTIRANLTPLACALCATWWCHPYTPDSSHWRVYALCATCYVPRATCYVLRAGNRCRAMRHALPWDGAYVMRHLSIDRGPPRYSPSHHPWSLMTWQVRDAPSEHRSRATTLRPLRSVHSQGRGMPLDRRWRRVRAASGAACKCATCSGGDECDKALLSWRWF